MSEGLSIGQLAKAGGVGVETIRFYERRKLLKQPARRYGQIRRYARSDLSRLQFIKRAKHAGFRLSEIASLLRLEETPSCRDARAVAAEKLQGIKAQINELNQLRRELADWIARCDANRQNSNCPFLDELGQPG